MDFFGRRVDPEIAKRIPPGQHFTSDFPILSLGPTPNLSKDSYSLEVDGEVKNARKFSWAELEQLPQREWKTDIHCVTKWSKLDTVWRGVPFEEILKIVEPEESAKFVIASSADGYTTNLPLADLIEGQAIVALAYEGEDITAQHGGPVRLLIPHLYLWKSAKWLNGLTFLNEDTPGFWEARGYHNYGDPWKEERYSDE